MKATTADLTEDERVAARQEWDRLNSLPDNWEAQWSIWAGRLLQLHYPQQSLSTPVLIALVHKMEAGDDQT